MDFIFKKADCLVEMQNLPDESIDCILTDPPYKYLKNQKLEVDFDECLFFNQAKRILTKDGFIVLFGRGASFYRWNTILADLGFEFKEEVIWDKRYTSSSMFPLSRLHETISIWNKSGKGINKIRIPYVESKFDIDGIKQDISRIRSACNRPHEFEAIIKYLEHGIIDYSEGKAKKFHTTIQGVSKEQVRPVKMLQAIKDGMIEKSIIRISREHYSFIHPTQKPIRLLERLLALTTKENDTVLDAFAGSCSTGIACRNMNRSFIGYEIDDEYYSKAMDRVNGKTLTGFEKTEAGGQKINYGQTEINFNTEQENSTCN